MSVDLEVLQSPDKSLTLKVAPGIGGSIAAFYATTAQGRVDLMRAYDSAAPAEPLYMGSFPLTPFSNRIGHGRMKFEGEELEVKTPFRSGDHPNHGDGFQLPWRIAAKTPHSLELALDVKGEPYSYSAKQVFTLTDQGLSVDIAITNKAGRALPYGTGHHPYFPRNDKTTLKASLQRVWRSENMLPVALEKLSPKWNFGAGVALSGENLAPAAAGDDGSAYIDHCFQDWNQKAEIAWPDKKMALDMTADAIFKNFVIFVPANQDFFCAEPVTNITDGFNLMERGVAETGTIVLKSGETLSGNVAFKPRAL